MQIKTITDYAIKTILSIASAETAKSSKEISDEICVPREYLIQIAKPLKSAGILIASPGKNGGYLLGRPPKEITLWDILAATEGTKNINRCLEKIPRMQSKGPGKLSHPKGIYHFTATD